MGAGGGAGARSLRDKNGYADTARVRGAGGDGGLLDATAGKDSTQVNDEAGISAIGGGTTGTQPGAAGTGDQAGKPGAAAPTGTVASSGTPALAQVPAGDDNASLDWTYQFN